MEAQPVSFTFQQKIAATIISAVIVGLLAWTASTVIEVRADLPVIRLEIQHLRETITTGMVDRFTGSNAKSEFALRDARLQALETRITILDADLRTHEKLSSHGPTDLRLEAMDERVRRLEKEGR